MFNLIHIKQQMSNNSELYENQPNDYLSLEPGSS